ncbi:SGNH/GDSL hydrolase family protein [Arabiibacter massiliensis]|uniref:SGNH/GDSL hydrolase family protein n=1 Tax=Arabiibacter massiliensis TaxID=1870985 RepID=UPI0018D81CB0|nr:SGNH/GDSL hydrolase family protein [Arabiibacter massiliensis]
MRRGAAVALAVVLATALCPARALAAAGDAVVHKKTGTDIEYTVTAEAGPGQGSAVLSGIADDAAGTVAIPASIMVMEDWEQPATYAVAGIAAGAFSGAAASSGAVERIDIEGVIDVDPAAFSGLSEATAFTVRDQAMVERLEAAGIAPARIACEPLLTKYVVFGDSIAAGYALQEYDNSDPLYDQMPTPSDAFATLVGAHLADAYGPAATDNLAASGWTSQQLLDALSAGAYDAALADATLVSVTIGSNDLLGRFIEIIAEALAGIDDLSAEEVQALAAEAEADPSALEADPGEDGLARKRPSPVRDLVEKIAAAIAQINEAIEADPQLLAACETFAQVNQPSILAELHARAPHAQVCWTTLYNPFYGQVLDLRALFPNLAGLVGDDVVLSIDLSGAGARYIELMNEAFDKNTEGCTAVDLYEPFNNPGLTNVQIGRAEDGSIVFGVDSHPNHDGHALIARLMNAAIDATYRPVAPPPAPEPEAEPPAAGGGSEAAAPGTPLASTGDGAPHPLVLAAAAGAALSLAAGARRRMLAERDAVRSGS